MKTQAKRKPKTEGKKSPPAQFRGSDLFECIRRDLWNDSMSRRPIKESPLDFALTVVKKASTLLVSKTLPYHQQYLFMYETKIAISVSVKLHLVFDLLVINKKYSGFETNAFVGAIQGADEV